MSLRKLTIGLLIGTSLAATAGGALAQIARGSLADFSDHGVHDPNLYGANAPPPNTQPTDKYTLAYQDLRAGRFKEADRTFEELLAQTPDDPVVLTYSGMAMYGMNNFKGARRAYEHAIRSQSRNAVAHRELGLTLIKLGDTKNANVELTKLRKFSDDCKDKCQDAAVLKEAVKILEGALATAPAK